MLSDERYRLIFGKEAEFSVFCPYRVCPLGAHVDHNLGTVTGFALDRGVSIAFDKTENGKFELCSMQFNEPVLFSLFDIPEKKAGDWADYLRGTAKALKQKYELKCGIRAVICGSLPIGGLSSSAAVTLAFLKALCIANDIKISEDKAVALAKGAENDYVGVGTGKLDQCCEIFSRKNQLLYYDTLDDSRRLIDLPGKTKPFKIGIFFSGLSRTLVNSDYNLRVSELKQAAKALTSLSGKPAGDDILMRFVPPAVFEEYKEALPEKLRKRAEHFFTEQERVKKGVSAWSEGNLEQFGALMTESGLSSINNWEAGSPELKALSEIITAAKGVYGGRFSGAGFKGSCAALIDPEYEEDIRREVSDKYLALFPEHTGLFSVDFCETENGIDF